MTDLLIDATMKGFFGPTGVDEAQRGKGIGEALLIATLKGMREAGHAYGVIGGPGRWSFIGSASMRSPSPVRNRASMRACCGLRRPEW
jgi:predicted GNAT family acetyltransferase